MHGAEPDYPAPATNSPGVAEGAALRDWLATQRDDRSPGAGRPRSRTRLLILGVVGVLVVGAATTTVVLASGRAGPRHGGPAPHRTAPVGAGGGGPSTVPSSIVPPAAVDPGRTVSLSATGDIVMGSAPDALPPAGARDFFADVADVLRADIQMGNLEQPLTEDTGFRKCPPPATTPPGSPPPKINCFAFRSPPGYATVLRDAGFRLVNLANNHAYDFGAEGNRQTRAALDTAGIAYTGAPGEVTVVETNGMKIAVLGFSSYPWSQSVVDVEAAAGLVARAKQRADLVVVQMHVGAEGADQTHVRPGTELFLGENRGDSIKFGHAVVDAGADLVIGHGPHVMRAMEFYRDRLIAYSLGNFAGYRTLGFAGMVGVGGVLKVSLRRDGTYAGGSLVATRLVAPGRPAKDPANRAIALVRGLVEADLPTTGVRIGDDGAITARS
ncbi:MAG: hypothetical protein QOI74_1451 [Micromonosporaceae bacterium]|nr:hypothetical protein [Micromonosporaceae bacterium]